MHHHLTLTELAQREGMTEAEALESCRRLGVPVLHGRVDRSLFSSAMDVDPSSIGLVDGSPDHPPARF